MSAATLRAVRNGWITAARDAKYRRHRDLAPHFVTQARAVHRALLQLIREVSP
jgi:hypothetical protein